MRQQPEFGEQRVVIYWRDAILNRYPELKMLVASANGGKRPMKTNRKGQWYCAEGQRLKQTGVVKGFPDLFLYSAAKGFHGLAIEMKAPGEKPRPDQNEWIQLLESRGYLATWSDSGNKAIGIIIDYLGLPEGLKP